MLEKARAPIHELNRAVEAVIFMPIHVEDAGPPVQSARELFGKPPVRCCKSDTQYHSFVTEELRVSITRLVVTGPVSRLFNGMSGANRH